MAAAPPPFLFLGPRLSTSITPDRVTIDGRSAIVTVEAMGCLREIAQKIVEKEADCSVLS